MALYSTLLCQLNQQHPQPERQLESAGSGGTSAICPIMLLHCSAHSTTCQPNGLAHMMQEIRGSRPHHAIMQCNQSTTALQCIIMQYDQSSVYYNALHVKTPGGSMLQCNAVQYNP